MIILIAFVSFFIIVLSISLHEIGHFVYWKYGVNNNVSFTKDFNVVGRYKGKIKKHQLFDYYCAGIILGIIPVVASIIFFDWIIGSVILIMYLAGCSSDLKQIWGVLRK